VPARLPRSARAYVQYWLLGNAEGPGRHPVAAIIADAGWAVDTAVAPRTGVVLLRRTR
jgi:hypothetical protein